MLKPDEIEGRIKARRKIKPWVEARMDGLRGLDKNVRAIGQLMLGCDEQTGKRSVRARDWESRSKGARRLHGLDEATLLQLGRALFPQCPDVFEAAWRLHERLPFQTGYERRPFRAPGRPEVLRPRRVEFLTSLLNTLDGLDEDLPWLAAHAPHVAQYGGAEEVGVLLAAAIDQGGRQADEIRQVLRDSAEGTHEVGEMGRHVTAAFLCCEDQGCWEYVEKLLLAAQRQEGLRQAILESVDFSHPGAFRRMLRVIVDNGLARFSATVRAADVWLGLQLDSLSTRYVNDRLESLAGLLDDEAARAKVLAGDDAEAAFFALWSIAFDDAPAAVTPAKALLGHREVEWRFVGTHTLGMFALPGVCEDVLPVLDDEDVRVAVLGATFAIADVCRRRREYAEAHGLWDPDAPRLPWMRGRGRRSAEAVVESGDLFERLERLYARLPAKEQKTEPLVWPWLDVRLHKRFAADGMLASLGTRPRAAVLPYLDAMSPEVRQAVAEWLGASRTLDANSRQALLRLVGDPSPSVQEAAVEAMTEVKIKPDDLPILEPLLRRKSEGLRRGVLTMILSLKDAQVLDCAARLLNSKALPQRLGGLDLLRQMRDQDRSVEAVRATAGAYRADHATLSRDEQVCLDALLADEREQLTLDDALGLMDPAKLTPPTLPRKRRVKLNTSAAVRLIELIDAAVHEHREEPVTRSGLDGDRETEPLGSCLYGFGSPFRWHHSTDSWSKQSVEELPLREVWLDLWAKRPAAARDADGLEAARALLICSASEKHSLDKSTGWHARVRRELLGKPLRVKCRDTVADVLEWLVFLDTPANVADFAVDGFELLLSAIPKDKLAEKTEYEDSVFRELVGEFHALSRELRTIAVDQGLWTSEHTRRMFGLWRWVDEPLAVTRKPAGDAACDLRIRRDRVSWNEYVTAFEAGWANEHDLYDHLLGPRPIYLYGPERSFAGASHGSRQLRNNRLSAPVARVVQRAIDRVLEIELVRGEAETIATPAALALEYAGGADVLVRVLEAMGRDPRLQRLSVWKLTSEGKSSVFSHLVCMTRPGEEDTPAQFRQLVKSAGVSEDMLLAVAFYAPQWARLVEAALGWKLLAEAVWWCHAHTKDDQWRVDRELRESWNAEIRQLTPLTLEELMEGAVDVDWFNRVRDSLGDKRWGRLDQFAKYAGSGGGHKRAQLFAAAMLNKLSKAALVKDIEDKRKQDAVRALGLLPLNAKAPQKDVLARYKVMQEFVRTSRRFGSQRQASEKLAARIGQENLARTAGYQDPVRLQWAMEGLATADLAKGPVVVEVKGVTVELAVNADGLPEISARRGERVLKNIPANVKKAEAIQGLTERRTELRRSASRMRQALELAMCRGDVFGRAELAELMGNVLLRPLLERLVFVGEGVLGYPVDGGKGLRDHAGKIEPVKKNERLCLAHPVDLLASKAWSRWQRECFAAERVQPFKQVFRELYVLTKSERRDRTFSARYAGQQVNPRQALVLLGTRGWVTAPEAGVFRVFHDEKVVAWLEFMEPFYTPADVEGLTVEHVRFARRGDEELLALPDVPPRLLSEVFRDVDLVVSVAHRGGVDPEASASTIELRSALLRETMRLLGLKNVKIAEPHVHIRGTRAEYSVHLGSATTHMLPGGALFIVPVHSQHRGRLFLPFADDDPKTAEVLSKVLLLARDEEIKDPNVLDQIRGRG